MRAGVRAAVTMTSARWCGPGRPGTPSTRTVRGPGREAALEGKPDNVALARQVGMEFMFRGLAVCEGSGAPT
jgi:hypothetical protein